MGCPIMKMIFSWFHINLKVLVQCFWGFLCVTHPNGESLFHLAQYCLGMYFNCLNWYRVECYPEFFQMEVEWDFHRILWLYFWGKWRSVWGYMIWANWITSELRCYWCFMYFQSIYYNCLKVYGVECNPEFLQKKVEWDIEH